MPTVHLATVLAAVVEPSPTLKPWRLVSKQRLASIHIQTITLKISNLPSYMDAPGLAFCKPAVPFRYTCRQFWMR